LTTPAAQNGDPHHLDRPHRDADDAEQCQVDQRHERHAEHRVLRIDAALEPVVRRAVAILLHRFVVFRLGAIQLGAFEQHLPDAARLRAMRIVLGLAFRVMLAVNRRPLAGHHAGRHP
jgi:hypothetical protein